MFKINAVLRSSRTTSIWRGSVRLLHVGDANILPTSIDKNSDEFKVIFIRQSNSCIILIFANLFYYCCFLFSLFIGKCYRNVEFG